MRRGEASAEDLELLIARLRRIHVQAEHHGYEVQVQVDGLGRRPRISVVRDLSPAGRLRVDAHRA